MERVAKSMDGPPPLRALVLLVTVAGLLGVLLPAAGRAAVLTFGSPLTVPATLDTTSNLAYRGFNVQVPPNEEFPDGVVHTAHVGADTALWNTAPATSASAPVEGQALKIRLEGCAEQASGGPDPLTQIHFQDISPIPGGGAKIDLTSQPFGIPVCGQQGAGSSTVTTYEPHDLCMSRGDYVAFNDEGGYVPTYYRAGVAYEVMGSVEGSSMSSFIKANGTNNGAVLSAGEVSASEGFAVNPNEELMLQVVLGTGPDASYVCGGGTAGLSPAGPPLSVGAQTDGINHQRTVAVALYCRQATGCKGVATLRYHGQKVNLGSGAFSLAARTTAHLPLRVTSKLFKLIHKHGVKVQLTAVVEGKAFARTIEIRIL